MAKKMKGDWCKYGTGGMILLFGLAALLNTIGMLSKYYFDLTWSVLVILAALIYMTKCRCMVC